MRLRHRVVLSAAIALGASFAASRAAAVTVCASSTTYVGAGSFPTIQSAVQALPNPVVGESCVVIQNSSIYGEQVTVQNFTMSGGSITIKADIGMFPTVSPPSGAQAAFLIANASVNVAGINIVPANALPYGVFISSSYVQISSVNVQDTPAGLIGTAGIVPSSWTTVSYTSVTVNGGSASALWLTGSTMTTVSYSSATAQSSTGYALWLNGASSNTFINIYFLNRGGPSGGNNSIAAYLNNSNSNTIVRSTMTGAISDGGSSHTGGHGLYLNGSSSNTIVASVMNGGGVNTVPVGGNNAGYGLYINGGAYNTVNQSFMSAGTTPSNGGLGGFGLYVNSGSFNSFNQSAMNGGSGFAGAGHGAVISNGNYNTVSQSTMTGGAGGLNSMPGEGLSIVGSSSNTVKQSVLIGGAGGSTVGPCGACTVTPGTAGAGLSGAANYNAFSQCALTGGPGGSSAVGCTGTCSGAGGDGIDIGGGLQNTVNQSALTGGAGGANGSGGPGSSGGIGASLQSFAQLVTIAQSTVNAGSGGGGAPTGSVGVALYLNGVSSSTVSGDYIQGSTAVRVLASMNLTLSSSVLTAGFSGTAVYLDANNAGTIVLSTNAISGGTFGVYAATQAAGTQVWITSNTVAPFIGTANNTYGLYFNGLTSGATIENNTIAYQTSGLMGANTSYALYAQSSSGLLIDHNRINESGKITGGSYVAAGFVGTTSATFKFNDVIGMGPALTVAYLISATGASTGLVLKDNIFSSQFAVGGSSAEALIDPGSATGFVSDYNDWTGQPPVTFSWGGVLAGSLAAWKSASAQDAHSFSANPLWFNVPSGDFHPQSIAGRWNPGTQSFVTDTSDSPTIDAGDPAEAFGLEPSFNGGYVNIGSYGDTVEASKSQPNYSGCAVTKRVSFVTPFQAYSTISSALSALPSPLPAGESCVAIEDSSQYQEQVTVQNFAMSASSIAILADSSVHPAPFVSPPMGSTAAFIIANASVSVTGIAIQPSPTAPLMYGVFISSPYVQLSTVSIVVLGGAQISSAAVVLSSWTTVAYTTASMNMANGSGFWLTGSTMSSVSYSSVSINGPGKAALWLDGASSNTITQSFFYGQAAPGAYLDPGSNSNSISQSTMASFSGSYALAISHSSSNVVAQSYIAVQSGTEAAYLDVAYGSSISQCTMINGNGTGHALALTGASSNTITQSSMINSGAGSGNGAFLSANSYFNTISSSTMSDNGGSGHALQLNTGASSNTITRSYITNSAGYGAYLAGNANYNTISQSTITTSSLPGAYALDVAQTSTNTFSGDYIQGSTAAWVQGSTGIVIGGSVLMASAVGGNALQLDGGSVNLTLSSSVLTGGAAGLAAALVPGNSGLIVLSTNIFSGAMIGVLIATQTPGTRVWITSNTIVPAVSNVNSTYGLYFNGLASGAAVKNNTIAYRTTNAATLPIYAIYAQNSSNLLIDHNRLDEPGMINSATYVAMDFATTTNSTFTFNDVHSTGTGLASAYLIQATNSPGLTVMNNIFSSSWTGTGPFYVLSTDAATCAGLRSDYNDWASTTLNFSCGGAQLPFPSWRSLASTPDAHSILFPPLWRDVSVGVEDFHPLSKIGRCNDPGGSIDIFNPSAVCPSTQIDSVSSRTIDAGDPAQDYHVEPIHNGRRVNLGSYGDTVEASQSRELRVIVIR